MRQEEALREQVEVRVRRVAVDGREIREREGTWVHQERQKNVHQAVRGKLENDIGHVSSCESVENEFHAMNVALRRVAAQDEIGDVLRETLRQQRIDLR